LLKQFRDMLPEPPRPFPPPSIVIEMALSQTTVVSHAQPLDDTCPPSASQRVHPQATFKSQVNSLGLFCVYDKHSILLLDPEDPSSEDPLLQTPLWHGKEENFSNPFHPYPNESSLLLGDWYWNHGSQKSQSSFRKLVAIVGNTNFCPDDIQSTNWTRLDCHLGVLSASGNPPQSDTEEEYLDYDAGWMQGHAVISVPFSHQAQNPGTQEYLISNFFYCSLL
ncbi:hypothetical protein PISMIDRAFT_85011, partial [Pisolithus microcarpus 441]